MTRQPHQMSPARMQAACDAFNKAHPTGTRVRVWTGLMDEGLGRVGTVRDSAYILSGHTSVVHVNGVSGCIALTHVRGEP